MSRGKVVEERAVVDMLGLMLRIRAVSAAVHADD